MGDPGGKMNVELTFAEKKKSMSQWGNCCVLEGEVDMRTLLMSFLMYFICMSCGDSFWNLLRCFQVQICTLLGRQPI